MDEEGRYVVVMEVKTVVADKRTCLLSERSARRVEDGGRGGRGEGCLVVKANGRQRLCHTLSLIWQLPISSPINRLPGTLDQHKQNSFFSFFLPRFAGNVPRGKKRK